MAGGLARDTVEPLLKAIPDEILCSLRNSMFIVYKGHSLGPMELHKHEYPVIRWPL